LFNCFQLQAAWAGGSMKSKARRRQAGGHLPAPVYWHQCIGPGAWSPTADGLLPVVCCLFSSRHLVCRKAGTMSEAESELSLVDRAVAGDRVALSQLLLLHFDVLHRHVESRISQQLQGLIRADDILQQTFVRAAQAIGTFRPRRRGAFRAWLRTIADNLVRDAEKRRRRERRLPARPVSQPALSGTLPGVLEQLAGSTTSPSRRYARGEAVRTMQAALSGLPADQRDVLRRRYLQGQSFDEIAAATGRTHDAVRGLCYRARQNVRAMMGRSSLYFTS